MLISISKGGSSKKPNYHARFNEVNVQGESLVHAITNTVWSPIIWKEGRRLIKNYKQASMIALDFDNGGWTLSDTIEFLELTGYRGIVGTTKSHQKEKVTPKGVVTPACDRFRLLLAIKDPITDPFIYSEQMRHMESIMPTDKSCKDQGRFFYPCKEIVYNGGSKPYPLLSQEELESRRQSHEKKAKIETSTRQAYLDAKMLPSNLLNILRYGAPEGKRHATAYRVSAELTKFGWSEEKITTALQKTNLFDIGQDDLRRCIENGRQAANG